MTNNGVTTRFAPAPTGPLHFGGARCALYNWLFAKKHRGRFLLRIDDTNTDNDCSIRKIKAGLRFLGLDWDNDPDCIYRASRRNSIYKRVLDRLKKSGRVYRCFCDKNRLDNLDSNHYDRRCRHLSAKKRKKKAASTNNFVWRLKTPDHSFTITDSVNGSISFPADHVGDFILIRADDTPTYHFACVIDDHMMDVTHVIRGDDHLSNVPNHAALYDVLDWDRPTWAHLPMVHNNDGVLSKSDGSADILNYKGCFAPTVLRNYLAILGWSPPNRNDVLATNGLINNFCLDDVVNSPAKIDPDKLKSLHKNHTKYPDSAIKTSILSASTVRLTDADRNHFDKLLALLGPFKTINDFNKMVKKHIYPPKPKKVYDNCLSGNKSDVLKTLTCVRNNISNDDPLNDARKDSPFDGRTFYKTVRLALSGTKSGPNLHDLFDYLGSRRVHKRLKRAVQYMKNK